MYLRIVRLFSSLWCDYDQISHIIQAGTVEHIGKKFCEVVGGLIF